MPAMVHVYAIKRASKRTMQLTAGDAKQLVQNAVRRLIEAIERTSEPFADAEPDASPVLEELALSKDAFQFKPVLEPDSLFDTRTRIMRDAVRRGDHQGGASLARHLLAEMGKTADEDSEPFKQLSLQLLELQVSLRLVARARTANDLVTENRIVDFYRRQNGDTFSVSEKKTDTPLVSEAWKEFFAERTSGKPKALWNERTAEGQTVTFDEFREIVGDVPVGDISREMIIRYRDTVARLPANRQKRYPGKTAAELLTMEIPEAQLPSSRTVHEKLIRIGAFLRWCRETKRFLTHDPMAGVSVDVTSQSYAPFTRTDLEALFYSDDYMQGTHAKSWQFWTPLIALYSGARQNEIAQLTLRNVVQEDGVNILAVTDLGEGQRVKTKAGVRKIPISSKLVDVGFLEYVAAIEARGHERLFPDLVRGGRGWGQKVSRWFGDTYRPKCGVKADPTGGRKVFHSFRHTAITKALGSAQPLAHCQQVFGHEKSLLGETATYIAPFPVETLVPLVESLDFGLNHAAYSGTWMQYISEL